MNSIARPRGRFLKPVAIGIALIVVAAVALYAYASPYLALRQMKQAIDARDAQAISVHVDFPALRISLKQQLTDELMRRIDAQKRDNPLAILGAMIGSALVGPLVDAYATPDGVAALMSGLPPHARPGQRPPELNPPSDPASAAAAGTGAPPGNAGVPGSASGAARRSRPHLRPRRAHRAHRAHQVRRPAHRARRPARRRKQAPAIAVSMNSSLRIAATTAARAMRRSFAAAGSLAGSCRQSICTTIEFGSALGGVTRARATGARRRVSAHVERGVMGCESYVSCPARANRPR